MAAAMHCLAALLLLACPLALGKIEVARIHGDDRSLIPLSEAFGFAEDGVIDIKINSVGVYPRAGKQADVKLENLGIFLSSAEAEAALESDLTDARCPLEVDKELVLFTFKDAQLSELVNGKDSARSFTFQRRVSAGGLYYLFFANCEPQTFVSFTAHIALYNVDLNGNKDYLSVGETELDTVLWAMFALFTVATSAWGVVIWRNRPNSHNIHYLMLALGVFKCLTLLSQSLMYHYIETTGNADGWNIAFYVFTFFRGVLFFTVVVLVGTGWSLMRPFLADKEKRILMVVIPLQVFANIAIVITDEENPSVRDWFTWRDVFHLVDIICCCAILFPIVWSIKHLREASQTDGKAARNLEKLTLFRQFYVMVVVYIYFTRIVVYLLRSTMQYEYSYIADGAEHLATLAFYLWTALKFRPHGENPYLKLAQDEEVEMT